MGIGHHEIKRIPINFDRLGMLRIDIARIDAGPTQLIQENTKLKELLLPTLFGCYDFEHAVDVMTNLTVLEKLSIGWREYYHGLVLHRLFTDVKTLKEVTLILHDSLKRDRLFSLSLDGLTHVLDADNNPLCNMP